MSGRGPVAWIVAIEVGIAVVLVVTAVFGCTFTSVTLSPWRAPSSGVSTPV